MSLGLVVLEEKSLTRMYTPQSDNIKYKNPFENRQYIEINDHFLMVKNVRQGLYYPHMNKTTINLHTIFHF